VVAIVEWLSGCLLRGSRLIVPAIVYYEVKRELRRAEKVSGLARLEEFIAATPGRYLPLSDKALRLAAELWAKARQQGRPTADPDALDIDVIIAAQALTFGPAPVDLTIATTNPKHLSQFVSAKHWRDITL
jgi:predicted nucleic acid-binding protein